MNARLCPAIRALVASCLLAASAAHADDALTKVEDLGVIALPSSLVFSDIFSTPLPFGMSDTDRFFDDYQFTVAEADYSTFASSIDLADVFSINGLAIRLYQGSLASLTTGPVGPGLMTMASSGAPLVASGGLLDRIGPINLLAGTYVLEVMGRINGTAGGSYAGIMNFASPVPEPGALALLFSGVGVLGFAARRRKV